MEAQLTPVLNSKSFRPTAPYSSALKPKASAAPAPQLRPSSPAPAEITRAPDPLPPGQPLSAAEEIAGMLAPGRTFESADDQASFDPSLLLPNSSPAPKRSKPPGAFADPLFFRKTAIPVLMTFGVILLFWGFLLITSGEDNALPILFPYWTPFALFAFGALFLILAIINILSLKSAETPKSPLS
jgi:hypothetical protein